MSSPTPSPQRGSTIPAESPVPSRAFGALGMAIGMSGAALAVWHHLTTAVLPWDDAYITFRYAQRLAAGAGLTYNDGERVFGSSTPLYALWLGAAAKLGSAASLPLVAVRGNLPLLLLAALALGFLAASISGRRSVGWAAGGLFLMSPWMLAISTGGMETSLFLALGLGGLALCLRGWFPAGAVCLGLAAVTRPEGLFLALPAILLWGGRGRPRPAACVAGLLLPGIAWIVMASVYFGSPIPHSIVAKSAPLYELPFAYAFLTTVAWTGRWSLPLAVSDPAPLRDFIAFFLAQAGAFALAAEPRARRAGGWIVTLALEFVLLFYALTNPQLFDWYAATVFPFCLLSVILGFPALGRMLAREPLRGERLGAAGAAAGLALATGLALVGWAGGRLDPGHEALRLRTLAYREAAQRLNRIAPKEATVAAAEIGALGWYWHGRILDGCGLVSPQALPYLPVPADDRPDFRTSPIPTGLVETQRPEFVVAMPVFIATTLERSAAFARDYRLVDSVPLIRPVWGSDAVRIYRRVEPPGGAPARPPEAQGESAPHQQPNPGAGA